MLRSWREARAARRRGRRDGRAGVPAAQDEAIPFDLREILARAEQQVHELFGRWRREDGALAVELTELGGLTAEAAERLAETEARRDAARADHERRVAEEDERLARLQAQLEELPTADAPELRFDDPAPEPPTAPMPIGGGAQAAAVIPHPSASEPDRSAPQTPGDAWTASVPHPEGASWHGIGRVIYWAVIGLILAGEFPLNAVAFRLFGESDLFTYVMTASLAVALIAIAHFLGSLVSREIHTPLERVLIGVFSAFPVAGIAVISLIRYDYLTRVGEAVGPVIGTLAFALINLLVFAAAAGWSYLRHDPRTVVNRRAAARDAERERDRAERRAADREREARRRAEEQRRRETELEREHRRHALEIQAERHRTELEARKHEAMLRREQILETMRPIREAGLERLRTLAELDREVEAARTALAELEQRARAIALQRTALREATEARLREIRAHRDRLVYAYCSANVRAREDRTAPRCFERIPRLEVPAELEAAEAV